MIRRRADDLRSGAAVAGALALLLAALAFRTLGTMHEPLWLDEAYSAYAADKGFAFLWQVVPLYETHPPFYYSLLRLWTLAIGDGRPAMRALGMACGMATLPLILLSGREMARATRLDSRQRILLALALLALAALSPALIAMSREVRPYPVLILAYAAAILAALRLGRRTAGGGSLRGGAYFLYLGALAAILWLHNLGPLFGASVAFGLLAMVARRSLPRGDWLWLVGGHVLLALVYLPALAIALDQAPTWIHSTWLRFSFAGLGDKIAVLYALPSQLAMLVAGFLALAGLACLARSGEGRRIAALLLLTGLLPVAASIALSVLVAPVFILRTMTPVAVPAVLLLGYGAVAARGIWRWPALAALLVLVAEFALVDVHARQRPPQEDWFGAIRWLEGQYRPGDIILAYPNEGALPFAYAVRDLGAGLAARPIPTAVPSLGVGGWHPTGSRGVVSLPRDRLRAIAAEPAVRAAPTVWLLRLGAAAYDKGDMFLDELGVGRRRVAWFDKEPIDIVGLRRLSAPRAAPAGAAAAR